MADNTNSAPPLAPADPAQFAALSPEARAGIAAMLKNNHPGRAAEIDALYNPAPPDPAAPLVSPPAGAAPPRYPSSTPGRSGLTFTQAKAGYAAIQAPPEKFAHESDDTFAARVAGRKAEAAKMAETIKGEFGIDILAADARTDSQRQFDTAFPAATAEHIQLNLSAVDGEFSPEAIADLDLNMRGAIAQTGLPAPLASAVGSEMIRSAVEVQNMAEDARPAHYQRVRDDFQRITGLSIAEAKDDIRRAIDRIEPESLKEIASSGALESVSVLVQLRLHGQRLAARG